MGNKDVRDGEANTSPDSTTGSNRRDFLKDSAVVAGAGVAAATLAGSVSGAFAAESKPTSGTDGKTPLEDVVARPDLWYYPGEAVAPDEMRVTLMGTGWGNII
jgi:hypothetical protein